MPYLLVVVHLVGLTQVSLLILFGFVFAILGLKAGSTNRVE
jgi:hypothetical protein